MPLNEFYLLYSALIRTVIDFSLFWGMSLCRQVDDDKGRNYELEQSAVKCMRGILFCYMRQAAKVIASHVARWLSCCTWVKPIML